MSILVKGNGRVVIGPRFSGEVPPSIPNLEYWVDASDISTINGGSPVNDDPVYLWLDKSGNGHNNIQNTFISQPLWKSSGFGSESKPYIDFDGVNDFFDLSSFIEGDTDMTIITVMKKNVGGVKMVGITTPTSAALYGYFSLNSIVYARNQFGYGTHNTLTPGNDYTEMVGTATMAGTDIKVYKNGQLLIQSSFTNTVNTLSFETVAKHSTTGTSDGRITEIIMYNRVLSTIELTQINDYLSLKYGTLS
jgi:hypothetical protein|tara:strand:- start:76 stop:822 length:747 start_codon:yes stop_codon:yes gene_type:complete